MPRKDFEKSSRKDFTDKRAAKKERRRNKELDRSNREIAAALRQHKLGWTTRDGKEH